MWQPNDSQHHYERPWWQYFSTSICPSPFPKQSERQTIAQAVNSPTTAPTAQWPTIDYSSPVDEFHTVGYLSLDLEPFLPPDLSRAKGIAACPNIVDGFCTLKFEIFFKHYRYFCKLQTRPFVFWHPPSPLPFGKAPVTWNLPPIAIKKGWRDSLEKPVAQVGRSAILFY